VSGPATPRDRQFARLLCASADAESSGILTASRGRLRRLFCLSRGWMAYATSNLVEEQFVEYLVRTGAMSPNLRAQAIETAAKSATTPIAFLRASGHVDGETLKRGMEGLVRELMTSTLEWPDGAFKFEGGLPKLDGEVTVRIAPRALVIAHAKRYPASLDALRIRIGPPDLRPVASTDAHGTQLDALGAYLIANCDGTRELARVVKGAPAEEEPTLRTIYGFLLAGLLDPEDPETKRKREARGREEVLTREECLGRLAMAAGQDHYGVLGIDRTARDRPIRDAYYALARRYHPDRFRSGPLADLLPKFEGFFMSVTEAYNTLVDPERRAEYDEQLTSARAGAEAKGADTAYLAKENFRRGRALASQRKFTEAVTFLENAIQLDPNQAEFHLELGLVMSRNPRHREDAERHLLRAAELAPAAVGAYVGLGQLYLKSGRAGHAARMAREALRWEPGHLEASELLAAAGDAGNEPDARRGA
jgi:tetratricopeptide (TPR) repeat protein